MQKKITTLVNENIGKALTDDFILDAFDVPDLKYAIISEDSKRLSKANTIGKKTAERIILELKDKIDRNEILGVSPLEEESDGKLKPEGEAADAVDALVSLGYDRKSSEKAVMSVDGYDKLDSSEILKKALTYLF